VDHDEVLEPRFLLGRAPSPSRAPRARQAQPFTQPSRLGGGHGAPHGTCRGRRPCWDSGRTALCTSRHPGTLVTPRRFRPQAALGADRVRLRRPRAGRDPTPATCTPRTRSSPASSAARASTAACAVTRGCRCRLRRTRRATHCPATTRSPCRCAAARCATRSSLRLIAINRAFHFLVLGALALLAFVFASHRNDLRGPVSRAIADLQGGVIAGGRPRQNTACSTRSTTSSASTARRSASSEAVIAVYALRRGHRGRRASGIRSAGPST